MENFLTVNHKGEGAGPKQPVLLLCDMPGFSRDGCESKIIEKKGEGCVEVSLPKTRTRTHTHRAGGRLRSVSKKLQLNEQTSSNTLRHGRLAAAWPQ